jgi:hypothetical protein
LCTYVDARAGSARLTLLEQWHKGKPKDALTLDEVRHSVIVRFQ